MEFLCPFSTGMECTANIFSNSGVETSAGMECAVKINSNAGIECKLDAEIIRNNNTSKECSVNINGNSGMETSININVEGMLASKEKETNKQLKKSEDYQKLYHQKISTTEKSTKKIKNYKLQVLKSIQISNLVEESASVLFNPHADNEAKKVYNGQDLTDKKTEIEKSLERKRKASEYQKIYRQNKKKLISNEEYLPSIRQNLLETKDITIETDLEEKMSNIISDFDVVKDYKYFKSIQISDLAECTDNIDSNSSVATIAGMECAVKINSNAGMKNAVNTHMEIIRNNNTGMECSVNINDNPGMKTAININVEGILASEGKKKCSKIKFKDNKSVKRTPFILLYQEKRKDNIEKEKENDILGAKIMHNEISIANSDRFANSEPKKLNAEQLKKSQEYQKLYHQNYYKKRKASDRVSNTIPIKAMNINGNPGMETEININVENILVSKEKKNYSKVKSKDNKSVKPSSFILLCQERRKDNIKKENENAKIAQNLLETKGITIETDFEEKTNLIV